MGRVQAVFTWIADRLGLSPTPPPPTEAEQHEQRQVRSDAARAIRRADRAIDTWNERIRESWRADGA